MNEWMVCLLEAIKTKKKCLFNFLRFRQRNYKTDRLFLRELQHQSVVLTRISTRTSMESFIFFLCVCVCVLRSSSHLLFCWREILFCYRINWKIYLYSLSFLFPPSPRGHIYYHCIQFFVFFGFFFYFLIFVRRLAFLFFIRGAICSWNSDFLNVNSSCRINYCGPYMCGLLRSPPLLLGSHLPWSLQSAPHVHFAPI